MINIISANTIRCDDVIFPICPYGNSVNLQESPIAKLSVNSDCYASSILTPPTIGAVTIVTPGSGNVGIEETIVPAIPSLENTYQYVTNTTCVSEDSFTAVECCIEGDITTCDTVQYFIHINFDACAVPDDQFCCVPEDEAFQLDVLINDAQYLNDIYAGTGYTVIDSQITDIILPPTNGMALNENDFILYTADAAFTGVDVMEYAVFYHLENLAGEAIFICDTASVCILVEDCISLMPDDYVVNVGDTLYFNALSNDIIQSTLDSLCSDTLECVNPLPTIDSSLFTLLTSGTEINSLGNGEICFVSDTVGMYTYSYEVCTSLDACRTNTISINSGGASCLYFDGSDDRITAPNTVLDGIGTGDFTFEAWIEADAAGQNNNPVILSNRTGFSTGALFVLIKLSVSPYKALGVQLNGTNYYIVDNGTYNASLLDGQCHHVAASRAGDILSFYIDGALIGTIIVNTGASTTSGGSLYIGNETLQASNDFKGHISDVRVWDIARTATEIQNTASGYLRGTEAGLRANWKLNEGVGQTAYDNAPNGYDGILGANSNAEGTDPGWGESCCITCDPVELVTDGDFDDASGASFTSGLPQSCSCTWKSWCIDTDPKNKCASSAWNSFAAPAGCSPNFLIVDGFAGTGVVWSQPVTVKAGTVYEFSFWYYPNLSGGGNPNLDIRLNGLTFANTSGISGTWTKYTFNVTSTVSGQALLEIVQTTVPQYSDFAIDHISLHEDCGWELCDPLIDLSANPVLTGTVHAALEVKSAGTVSGGADVSFKAGQIIQLESGFRTNSNVELEVIIENCIPE